MNRKGQITLGIIVMTFIGIIVALSLYSGAILNNAATVTETFESVNYTFTMPAVNATVSLPGRENITAIVLSNSTSGEILGTGNYSVADKDSDGNLDIVLQTLDASTYAATPVNATYSYKPSGYDNTSAGRGIMRLAVLLAALAIFAFSIPKLRGLLNI